MILIDGKVDKELSRDYRSLVRFLKDTCHGGKLSADVQVFKDAGIQTAEESFHWIMSTFDTDRDCEKVDPAGWMLENYLKNPVVLWSHDYKMPAIGYAKNVQADTMLAGDIVFNDKETDPFGYSIGQRVKAGSIRCGSVGFRVEEVEFTDREKTGTDLIYRKQELLEFSICNVPANPFAIHAEPQKTVRLYERLRTMKA